MHDSLSYNLWNNARNASMRVIKYGRLPCNMGGVHTCEKCETEFEWCNDDVYQPLVREEYGKVDCPLQGCRGGLYLKDFYKFAWD